jgi:hypothetical protein
LLRNDVTFKPLGVLAVVASTLTAFDAIHDLAKSETRCLVATRVAASISAISAARFLAASWALTPS